MVDGGGGGGGGGAVELIKGGNCQHESVLDSTAYKLRRFVYKYFSSKPLISCFVGFFSALYQSRLNSTSEMIT